MVRVHARAPLFALDELRMAVGHPEASLSEGVSLIALPRRQVGRLGEGWQSIVSRKIANEIWIVTKFNIYLSVQILPRFPFLSNFPELNSDYRWVEGSR